MHLISKMISTDSPCHGTFFRATHRLLNAKYHRMWTMSCGKVVKSKEFCDYCWFSVLIGYFYLVIFFFHYFYHMLSLNLHFVGCTKFLWFDFRYKCHIRTNFRACDLFVTPVWGTPHFWPPHIKKNFYNFKKEKIKNIIKLLIFNIIRLLKNNINRYRINQFI